MHTTTWGACYRIPQCQDLLGRARHDTQPPSHLPQAVCAAPVWSRTPSSVLSIAMYVGSASSVIMSPTSTTR